MLIKSTTVFGAQVWALHVFVQIFPFPYIFTSAFFIVFTFKPILKENWNVWIAIFPDEDSAQVLSNASEWLQNIQSILFFFGRCEGLQMLPTFFFSFPFIFGGKKNHAFCTYHLSEDMFCLEKIVS